MIAHCGILVLSLVLPLAVSDQALAATRPTPCQTLIPSALAAQLRERFPGWQAVELQALDEEDRALWVKKRGEVCPGAVRGKFDGTNRDQYAIVLIQTQPRLAARLLFAAKSRAGRFRFNTLIHGPTDHVEVVYKAPPGEYHKAGRKTRPITVKTELIVLETIGSGMSGFYFKEGRFRRILLSD